MLKKSVLYLILSVITCSAYAQVAKEQVLQLSVTTNPSGGITISWPSVEWTGSYQIFKKEINSNDWGQAIATLAGNISNYEDKNVPIGTAYDYQVIQLSGTSANALGYVYAGNQLKNSPIKTGLILLIDSNYIIPLTDEIDRLISDLNSEGWQVYPLYAGRNEKVSEVKARIKDSYTKDQNISTLFILGHVPVPYSGDFTGSGTPPPDGHVEGSGNHTGAWAADAYYGDMDFEWQDETVNNISGAQERNHNIPNDGKFDHSKIPSDIELEVGRVDLFDMPIINSNDTALIKNYLDRNHNWRTGKLKSVERGLIDNHFKAFNIASTGYHNFSTFLHQDSIFDNLDYVPELSSKPYLWSYGCGPGSYTTCSGVAKTTDFVSNSFDNIFTILAGSFFGDWDVSNNFLRAPLTNSSLASFWGGIPKWYIHHMALGKNIGYGSKITINNNNLFFNGLFNNSQQGIHITLMGDPTLVMHPIAPVTNLSATSNNGNVELEWTKVDDDIDGYLVYRVNTKTNQSQWLTDQPISNTTFIDDQNWITGEYEYYVVASKLITNPSGSYYSIGGCYSKDADTYKATVSHFNSINSTTIVLNASLYPNPSTGNTTLSVSNLQDKINLKVKTLDGKTLINQIISNSTETIATQNLAKSIYIIELTDQNGIKQSFRFVKL